MMARMLENQVSRGKDYRFLLAVGCWLGCWLLAGLVTRGLAITASWWQFFVRGADDRFILATTVGC